MTRKFQFGPRLGTLQLGPLGKDDEMGTLNLITPAKRKQAAAIDRADFDAVAEAAGSPVNPIAMF
jgi:hypothetical protein